jgi:septal ring-binding cell division protein DamX
VPRRLPTVSPVGPVFSRRQVLSGGAAIAVFGLTGSACSSPPAPPEIDELESQLNLARHDSELATAAAAAAATPVNTALTEVAAERTKHAQALATEIARLAVNPTSTTSQATSTTSAVAAPAPTLSDVINSLRGSAASASHLAMTSSGYRAGLLGSIAAACTASYSVALVFGGSTS